MTKEKKLRICLSSCSFLKWSLMWPTKNEEFKTSKGLYIRLIVFVIISGFTFTAMTAMHLVKSVEVNDYNISEDLAILASNIGYILMMLLYVIRQKDLESLLLDLSNFKKYNKPPKFDEVNRKLDWCAKMIFGYTFLGSVFYNGVKILTIPSCKKLRKINEVCGVAIPYWVWFNTENWSIKLPVIAYTFLVIIILVKVALLVSLQVLEIACNIKLRLDQLNCMIVNCFDGDVESNRRRLNECIKYHKEIIGYSQRFNKCFSSGMFIHLAMTAIICGCLATQIVKEYQPEAIVHIGGWTIAIFISSFGGQILMDSSVSVADAAYSSAWFEGDVRLRKDLILVIRRAQKAFYVSTGAFNVLSFGLFFSVMKMSYSIFTLLK
ncbi:odorant receptor 85b-like [Tribolium madens]|uniref:odorant receptor 85b-like n=1 Tax=Tribolium madens TaxID=41895 RepID=UPI001CF71E5E|nr:odorant receptor 85b-like [Tribolium madens]